LGLELRAPIFRQAVVLPAAAALRRSPLRCDEAVTLQPVQHRIQHAVGPMQVPAGQLVDALDDGVAVALTLGEDGEHEWRCRRGNQNFSEGHTSEPYTLNFYVWSSQRVRQEIGLQPGWVNVSFRATRGFAAFAAHHRR